MNTRHEDISAKMKALTLPTLDPGGSASPGPSVNSGGSWSSRPSRPRPSLNMNVGGGGGGGFDSISTSSSTTSGGRRPPPRGLIFTSSSPSRNSKEAAGVIEQENKLKEIMRKSGQLTIGGHVFNTHIDDLELLGDLGNGTCGHVVKMRHRHTGEVIAVKQMRRTGNSDETKRIIMDLDVVLKSDCQQIVLCLGCFISDSDVWIAMELMATCFDKLLKQLKQPIPEQICGKVAVATVKALHYLKEHHGVIHRDVKPSNILLDTCGRVKLCDFGISGRLVDSKAKTRSAGCAAYMAPERIDPPNPNNPNYDIRADVWSLGITLVEMATGHFPYRDCKTDFEVLTKVLQDDPPLLPPNKFSREFELFVQDCLMKDPKDRPKYKKLLMHPFIKKFEREEVDVGAWYRQVISINGSTNLTTPNNNQLIGGPNTNSVTTNSACLGLDALSNISSERTSFKPQPSPRIVRSWRPSTASAAAQSSTTTPSTASPSPLSQQQPSYPSAISEHRRPSFEAILEAKRLGTSQAMDFSSQYVTSKPPPALPSPSEPMSSLATASSSSSMSNRPSTTMGGGGGVSSSISASNYQRHYGGFSTGASSVTDSPMLMRSRRDHYYERWQPPNGGLVGNTTSTYSSPYTSSRMASSTSSPYSGSYGSPSHHYSSRTTTSNQDYNNPRDRIVSSSAANHPETSGGPTESTSKLTSVSSGTTSTTAGGVTSTVPRYGYRESPRTVRKFDFTYPQTSIVGSYHEGAPQSSTSSPASASTAAAAGTVSLTSTPQHRGYSRRLSTEQNHHVLPHHYQQSQHSYDQTGNEQKFRETAAHPHHPSQHQRDRDQQQQQQQRSPSQERDGRSRYFGGWRSTLSSWTPSFRRLRTASSDRNSAFDTARRFQPSYRSWNEKDNFYPSSMNKR